MNGLTLITYPSLRRVIISTTSDDEGYVTIMLEKVERKDFEDYLKTIKKDFPEEIHDMESGDFYLYEGKNSKSVEVQLQYNISGKTLVISGMKNKN
jgi:hypothetical protein